MTCVVDGSIWSVQGEYFLYLACRQKKAIGSFRLPAVTLQWRGKLFQSQTLSLPAVYWLLWDSYISVHQCNPVWGTDPLYRTAHNTVKAHYYAKKIQLPHANNYYSLHYAEHDYHAGKSVFIGNHGSPSLIFYGILCNRTVVLVVV